VLTVGEKADLVDAAGQASQSVASGAVDAAVSVSTDVTQTTQKRITEVVVDHGIDEVRERLRKDKPEEPPA
jgi:hypothetical protein